MKKIIALILCAVCILSVSSCGDRIKEYKGTALTSLEFRRVDYNGGFTREYILDFENNTVSSCAYLPSGECGPIFDIIAEFSEEEEERLINRLYTYGLFGIRDEYKSPPLVMDGGGWGLVISYSDGTQKKSKGSNNSPDSVFEKCAKAFYDICGDGIVAHVPKEYYTPPNLSYAFRSDLSISSEPPTVETADCRWNGFERTGNNIYEINKSSPSKFFNEGNGYTLVLYTANYTNTSNIKFRKCTVTEYGYNESLTNGTVIHSGGWFGQIELPIELNKIYVVRLDFKNGDFAEYTFNTGVASEN